MPAHRPAILLAATIALMALLVFTGLRPYDRTPWWLEVFPVIISLPLLGVTCRLCGDRGADAFLGTQGEGEVWDTQSDMPFALIGAIEALLLLARLQDCQISQLAADRGK